MNAWTIVDSVHVARQLLQALDYNTPRASEFQEKYEAASLLRNSMDHLKGQSQNLANKKRKPPLFGTLSYVYLTADTLIREVGSNKHAAVWLHYLWDESVETWIFRL